MGSKRTIAIVGAGFCGTTVAVKLLRASQATVGRILLVERVERQIGGVAYSTTSGSHALNVPAGRMSAFEDDPDDFLRFVRASDPSLTGGTFVPRRTYGEYLAARLDEARRASDLPLVRVAGKSSDRRGAKAVRLALEDGRVLRADQLVLAIGNFPPGDPRGRRPRSMRAPLRPGSVAAATRSRSTDGTTCCCSAPDSRCSTSRSRSASRPPRPVHAISRRGLLPQPHRVSATPPPHLARPRPRCWPAPPAGCSARCAARCGQAAAAIDWREVVTSLRDDTPALWQRLDVDERAVPHACGRSGRRIATARRPRPLGVDSLIARGELNVIAGRVDRLRRGRRRRRRTLRRRGDASASDSASAR